MNKLITTDTGGYPFVMDDIRFLDDSIRDAFKGLNNHLIDSTLTNDGFIFDKINYTATAPKISASDSWTFPETYAVLNGEILLIPETILSGTVSFGDCYCLELDDSFTGTAPGLKTFLDSSSNETYQIRKGKLTLIASASVVLGTDVPILYGIGVEWNYLFQQRYSYRTRAKFGIDTIQTQVSANETRSINNETRSINNETDIDAINSAWTSLSTADILSKIKYNGSSSASLSGDTAVLNMNFSNSRIKYKVIGKTLIVDINLKEIEIPDYSTTAVRSFIIDFSFITGLNNILSFNNLIRCSDSVYAETVSGTCLIQNHGLSSKKVLINLREPFGSSYISFNREYIFTSSTSKTISATADLDRLTKWTFEGQFTCEIN